MSSQEDQQKNLEKVWADLLAKEDAEENCNESEGSDNDEVETSSHASDTEQSADEITNIRFPEEKTDSSPEATTTRQENLPICFGKDQTTKWYWVFEDHVKKKSPENILREASGPTATTNNLKNKEDIWNAFFTPEMLECIVSNTNIYIGEKLLPHWS